MTTSAHVYTAVAEITAELARSGIAKDRRNDQQGYRFRGIDDVFNALAPLLAKHKLCVLPRVLSREVTERQTAKGGVLFYVIVDVAFDLVSAVDGSRHESRVMGEAMDSGDKATNKAMSAAYKYLALQTFCIPTEGDNDADAVTHVVRPAAPQPVAAPAVPPPFDDSRLEDSLTAIREADDVKALQKVFSESYAAARKAGNKPALARLTQAKDTRKAELSPKAAA